MKLLKKALFVSLATLITVFAVAKADTIPTLSQWSIFNGVLSPVSSSSIIRVPSLSATSSAVYVATNTSGTFYLTTGGSGGGGLASTTPFVIGLLAVVAASGALASYPYTYLNTPSTVVSRDIYGNSAFVNVILTTTQMSATGQTVSMNAGSASRQNPYGAGSIKFNLPDATTLYQGESYTFDVDNAGGASIYENDGTTLLMNLPFGSYYTFYLLTDGNPDGIWADYAALSNQTISDNAGLFIMGNASTSGDIIDGNVTSSNLLGTDSTGKIIRNTNFNTTGTASYFPFWNGAGNGLTSTSSLMAYGTTSTVGTGYWMFGATTTSAGTPEQLDVINSFGVESPINADIFTIYPTGISSTIPFNESSSIIQTGGINSFASTTIYGFLHDASGNKYVTSTGSILSGTANYNAYFNTSTTLATDTLYVQSNNDLSLGTTTDCGLFCVGTSTPLFSISSSTGYIAIGTSTPVGLLTMVGGDRGTGLVIKSLFNASIDLYSNGTGGHDYQIISTPSSAGVGVGALAYYDNTASRYDFTILPSGRTGINDNTSTLPAAYNIVGLSTGDLFNVETSSSLPTMYISSNGNVGIGTTTPSSTLHVVGNVQLSGSSTIVTASLGGSALLAGACSSVTSTIDASVTSSTAAFVTTPQNYPGAGAYWSSYLSAPSVLTTQVCEPVAATPVSSQYIVKIIK